jgi:hypothetical protein
MQTIDGYRIYRVTAGDPKEEDENKIFLSQGNTFEEADNLFTSLLAKREYPVIMLDEGDITIRGFRAPDRDEWDQKYTLLKEDLYRKSNPDKKPLYAIFAYKNFDPDFRNASTKEKAYKLLESDDFRVAFSSYISFLDDRFSVGRTPYNCIQLIDKNSRRIIEGNVFVPKKPETAVKPKKKPENPGYER